MNQIIPMIKKENVILFKNFVVYLSTLVVPILVLFMNIYIATHSIVELNVGIESSEVELKSVIGEFQTDNVIVYLKEYKNEQEMNTAFAESELDAYILVGKDAEVRFFYDFENSKGQLAYSYLAGVIQNYVLIDLKMNNGELLEDVIEAQRYHLASPVNEKSGNKSYAQATLLLTGMLWILMYTPLSTAINQITMEKRKKTLYLLYKAPVNPMKILLSKFSAVFLQYLLSVALYYVVAAQYNLIDSYLSLVDFFALTLVVFMITVLGYCIGVIVNSQGIETLFDILLTLPVIVLNSIGYTNLDFILKLLPTYYGAQIVNNIIGNTPICASDVAVCMVIGIVGCIFFCYMFRKRDAVKLCTYIN